MDGGEPFVEFVRIELTLNEATLRCINVDREGMYFDNISRQRPTCIHKIQRSREDDDWELVKNDDSPRHQIVLREGDGDDVDFWLTKVSLDAERGEAWAWDFDR
jgi:hypothetical protein